jgi:hypothetical protein
MFGASETAFAYLSASPNDRGDVAVSLSFGGPKHFPSHAVGVLTAGPAANRPGETTSWEWGLTLAREGRNTPYCDRDRECGKWGDYFAVRPHGKHPHTWVTVAYTIQSVGTDEALKAEAEFVWFENFADSAWRRVANPAALPSRR